MCPQPIDMAIGRDKRKMKNPTMITLTAIAAILVAAIFTGCVEAPKKGEGFS